MILAPSILASDFRRLEAQVRGVIEAGAPWIHVDVMDGHFVPNISFGPLVVRALRPIAEETGVLLDVHLMIEEPDRYLDEFAEAGAGRLSVHIEACPHLHRTIQRITDLGLKAGVAFNPATPVSALEEILPDVDLVLLMSVNPGFGGQTFIPRSLDKIRRLRERLNAIGSDAHIEVDGGVDPGNAAAVVAAGADVLVAGSAVFDGTPTFADNVTAFFEAVPT